MRELTTIGNLRTMRRVERATRLAPLRLISGMGDPRLDAAQAMNDALAAHGYNVADQPFYRTFQAAAGLTADGYPGRGTMTALFSTLDANGIARANVPIYPWTGAGGWGGSNAPSEAAWNLPLSDVSSPGFLAPAQPGGNIPPGPGPAPGPAPGPRPGPAPASPETHTALIVIGLIAAEAAAYGVARYMSKKKRRGGGRRRAPSRAIVLY
jgi:hypothetical protein